MAGETRLFVVAFVCVIGLGGLGLWSAAVLEQMVEAVNGRLPSDRQFQPVGWYPAKLARLITEYRTLFPAGPHLRRFYRVLAAMVLLLAVVVGFMFAL